MARAWPVTEIDPGAPVLENARRVLAVRIAELYSYAPVVPHPELSEALHDLRIAAKRLRYTLELFQSELGELAGRQIDRIKLMQEALGDLHDHDVRIAMIGDELSAVMTEQSHQMRTAIAAASADEVAAIATAAMRPPPDDPRRGLISLLGREHAARREAYERFRQVWSQLEAEGMRAELVALSAQPLPQAAKESQA